jgi:hypothetical protein
MSPFRIVLALIHGRLAGSLAAPTLSTGRLEATCGGLPRRPTRLTASRGTLARSRPWLLARTAALPRIGGTPPAIRSMLAASPWSLAARTPELRARLAQLAPRVASPARRQGALGASRASFRPSLGMRRRSQPSPAPSCRLPRVSPSVNNARPVRWALMIEVLAKRTVDMPQTTAAVRATIGPLREGAAIPRERIALLALPIVGTSKRARGVAGSIVALAVATWLKGGSIRSLPTRSPRLRFTTPPLAGKNPRATGATVAFALVT